MAVVCSKHFFTGTVCFGGSSSQSPASKIVPDLRVDFARVRVTMKIAIEFIQMTNKTCGNKKIANTVDVLGHCCTTELSMTGHYW